MLEKAVTVPLGTKVFSAAAFGILIHWGQFVHGEWHMKAPFLINLHIILALCLYCLQVYLTNETFAEAATATSCICAAYYASLFASITVYRVWFHRLCRFPGPALAGFSKWWHVIHSLDAKNHTLLHGLYEQYGDFVRTGPEELTVFHPEIHQLLDAYSSTSSKAEWYDITRPNYSVMTTRNKVHHGERRRIWDHGFHKKALHDYESRAAIYVAQLEAKVDLAAQQHLPVDMTRLLYFFGWDVMGDITFGKPFDMLKNDEWHDAISMLKKAMRFLGLVSPMPWLARAAFFYLRHVWIVKDWFAFIAFCGENLRERSRISPERQDIAGWLLKGTQKSGLAAADDEWVTGDTVLAIIAGSDTVTAALVALLYRLAEDRERLDKLYDEIADRDVRDLKDLQSASYLEALIHETLRLHHPLPTGGPRKTGPDGLQVGNTHIPGNITITGPRYSLGRNKDCFTYPDEFVPERWTTRKELVKDPALFIPFGTGRHVCTGKNLAWSEMRLVTALLVKKYKISFAPGECGFEVSSAMLDHVTPTLGPLNLLFEHRELPWQVAESTS